VGAFFTPTGIGTLVEKGKEKRFIDGREMMLEYALRADYALIRAYRADTMGNLVYRGIIRSFNAIMATAAKVTIVEADEIVPAGALDPETVVTPGIFVKRIVAVSGEGKL
jgi:3-oxoadipate CoA-transferase alpha subunit